MTKTKKEKKAGAVDKLARKTARKTLDLVLRVGDALEAVAAAGAPVVPPTPPVAKPATTEPEPVKPAPVASVATIESVEPAQVACVPLVEPVAPAPVAPVAVVPPVDDGARAALAIDAYAALHNLRIVDMPGYATLIDALKDGMAHRGSSFTDGDARSLLDAHMRDHFRVLGVQRHDGAAAAAASPPSITRPAS